MRIAALVVASVLFTVLAVLYFATPEAEDPVMPTLQALQTEFTETRRAVEDLRGRLTGLEGKVDAAALTASRTTMPEISDAQLERVLARMMETRGVPTEAVAEAAPDELNLRSIFASLQGTNPDQMSDVWTKVKEAGRMEELIALFEENARVNPNLVQAHVELGNAYLQQLMSMTPGPQSGVVATNVDQAFDAALEIDPNHWGARFTKGLSLSMWPGFLGKKQQAIDQFETLITQQEQSPSQPHFAQTYLYLGNLYQERGELDKAAETWAKGFGLFPNDADLRSKVK